MSKQGEKTYKNALELSKAFDANFLELAALLNHLNENEPDRFRDFIETSGVGRRKAYYLVKLDRTFKALNIPPKMLWGLGWTKLTVLTPHVTKQNVHELLEFAHAHTVKEIEAKLKGGNPEDNAHSLLLYFNDQNYQELVDELVKHGAKRKGRNLEGKEQALLKMLEKARK